MTPRAGGTAPDRGVSAASSDLPVEAAGMARWLPSAERLYALRRARRLGVGVDEVLLALGAFSSDALTQGAAREIGLPFERLDGAGTNGASRLPPEKVAALLRSGLMRSTDGRLVAAPRGIELRKLARTVGTRPELRSRLRLTTPERLAALVRERFATQLGWRAAYDLLQHHPKLCAGTLRQSRHVFALLAILVAGLFAAFNEMSTIGMWATVPLLNLLLFGSAVLKLGACTLGEQEPPAPFRHDAELPYYSLIVPLYREARVVPQLIEALDAIDYPREKLQILLVVEPDDALTAAALAARVDRAGYQVIVAPDVGPRTKPKAMNAALPFARGTLVGVYDAEDIPDPLQLRRACTVFAAPGGRRVGCVQARLAIDNLADSWITRQFAAEYAAYFDVILPMLSTARLPLPLGGTSNHFRREALEGVGGWDPFNVTEDADLGVRLAGSGWQTAVIASTTDEEAPRTLVAWMRQRTRWYKGWMQTMLVHARRPEMLRRGAGLTGALALLFVLGGGLAAALLNPFLLAGLLVGLWIEPAGPSSVAVMILEAACGFVFLLGYGSAIATLVIGMRRRRMPGIARVVLLVPVYWMMMSVAAWRGLFQLVAAPYRWEKTDHGLARTSRRRLLRVTAKGSGAARLRPRPAAA